MANGLEVTFGLAFIFPMNNKLFLSSIFVLIVLAKCVAQVPDSIRYVPPTAVFKIDTLPVDSAKLAATLAIDTTTLPSADSLTPKRKGFLYRTLKADYPNPNKALYLSLVIPAGGQLYNKRWWKAPIVWGGYGALIYSVSYNTSRYKRLQTAYLAELRNEVHEFSGIYDAGDLKRLRDGFDKNKQLSYIGIFVLHIIQSAEAFVDCHLKTFDVSDDLSLRFKPSIQPVAASQYPALGVGVAFNLSR